MTDEQRVALMGLIRKAEVDDDTDPSISLRTGFLREGVRVLGQALMELEVSGRLGAERYERTEHLKGQRNGYLIALPTTARYTCSGTLSLRMGFFLDISWRAASLPFSYNSLYR